MKYICNISVVLNDLSHKTYCNTEDNNRDYGNLFTEYTGYRNPQEYKNVFFNEGFRLKVYIDPNV